MLDFGWHDYRQDYQEDYDYYDIDNDDIEDEQTDEYWFDESLFNWNTLIQYFGYEF